MVGHKNYTIIAFFSDSIYKIMTHFFLRIKSYEIANGIILEYCVFGTITTIKISIRPFLPYFRVQWIVYNDLCIQMFIFGPIQFCSLIRLGQRIEFNLELQLKYEWFGILFWDLGKVQNVFFFLVIVAKTKRSFFHSFFFLFF